MFRSRMILSLRSCCFLVVPKNSFQKTFTILVWGTLILALDIGKISEQEIQAGEIRLVAEGKKFRLAMEGGANLLVEIPDQKFEWSEILPSGEIEARKLSIHDVNKLIIGSEGLSDQVLQVQRWLQDLNSDVYLDRERAEKSLSESSVAIRFRNLIDSASESPDLEVSHRISRILEAHRRAGVRPETSAGFSLKSFDRLELNSGEVLVGDCGRFEIVCQFRGQTLQLNRNLLTSLNLWSTIAPIDEKQTKSEVNESAFSSSSFRVNVYQRHEDEFYLPHQTLVDFEQSPTGEDLPIRFDVSSIYQSMGLLLDSQQPGYIGISGYRFRPADPPSGNSVCVFEAVGNTYKRYKGVMEIRFCLSNEPEIPAGVHEFGLFLTRVDNPRDFILEAYDTDGHLLAAVEASDAQTVFTGIKSTEPIAFLRVLSNPFLYALKQRTENTSDDTNDDILRIGFNRRIDEDYCADDFLFSAPVPLTGLPVHLKDREGGSGSGSLVVLNDGNRLRGDVIFKQDQVMLQLDQLMDRLGSISIPFDEIKAIHFQNPPQTFPKGQRIWMAQLVDGTILRIDPSDNFRSQWFEGVEWSNQEIVSIWLAPNQLRYPWMLPNRVDPYFPSLVFPTCIYHLEGLSLSETGYRWDHHEKVEQDLWIRASSKDAEDPASDRFQAENDPTPDLSKVDFDSTSVELIPTLWLRPPVIKNPNQGQLRLTDGQSFTLGGAVGFQLLSIDGDSVTIGWSDQRQRIAREKINSIVFPGTDGGLPNGS